MIMQRLIFEFRNPLHFPVKMLQKLQILRSPVFMEQVAMNLQMN